MDRRTCALLGAVYFELFNVLEELAHGEEIGSCTLKALKLAAEQLKEHGVGESVELVAGELERYNSLVRRMRTYLMLAANEEDPEEAEEAKKKLARVVEDANIARLRLSNYIIELLRTMARLAEEC